MKRRNAAAAALCAALASLVGGDDASGGPAERPFVVDKTVIYPSGQSFYVQGRIRIPKGVSVTVQKDTKIVGRGDGDAVIEVEGELQVHGVPEAHDIFRDVSIEPQPKFGQLLLDMVDFDGKSVGVKTPADQPVDGRIFIQNASFAGTASVDVTMCANSIDLQQVACAAPIKLKAVDPKGAAFNKVKLMLMNCKGGLSGGVSVERLFDCCVRGNVLGGERVTFTDCGTVTFDANYVTCRTLEFIQSAPGRFANSTVSKCDFQIGKLVAFVPYVDGKAETISVDHCWFDGETKEKTIREKYVKDRDDDPQCGVTVNLSKAIEKPQQLGWTVKR